MKFDLFFKLAKEAGIEASQLSISRNTSLSFSLFEHEIDSYSANDSYQMSAIGVYKGKFGSANTQKSGKAAFEFLVSAIKDNAITSEKKEPAEIFQGSDHYKPGNYFSSALAKTPTKDKIALLRELDTKIEAFDKRIAPNYGVSYEESDTRSEFYNSYGLKLKERTNCFVIGAQVPVKEREEVREGFDVYFSNDLSTFDCDAFTKKVCNQGLSKLGSKCIKTGIYPTVLKKDCFSRILSYFLSSVSSEEIQRHSSSLEGKLGTRIASPKLTITENPTLKNVFRSAFDDEGVATIKKDILKKGVLKTYLYNIETARKDGVTTTGNAGYTGSKMGISYGNIVVKSGKKSFEEMISPVNEGIFITSLSGLGTGMNAVSGDFSCQAEGFHIVDGKIAEPISLITISGNLFKLLKTIKDIDNESELLYGGTTCSNVLIKGMNIGGE